MNPKHYAYLIELASVALSSASTASTFPQVLWAFWVLSKASVVALQIPVVLLTIVSTSLFSIEDSSLWATKWSATVSIFQGIRPPIDRVVRPQGHSSQSFVNEALAWSFVCVSAVLLCFSWGSFDCFFLLKKWKGDKISFSLNKTNWNFLMIKTLGGKGWGCTDNQEEIYSCILTDR